MNVIAADDGNSTVGPGFWLSLFLLLAVGTLVVGIVAGVLAKRRSVVTGAPSTAWATASLVVVRVFLVYFVVVLLLGITGVFGESSSSLPGGLVERDGRALSVSAEAKSPNALCPNVMRRDGRGALAPLQISCPASRALAKADPPGAEVGFVGLTVNVPKPTHEETARYQVIRLISLLAFLVGAVAIERILARTANRQPFELANVRWLRGLAIVVAVDGYVDRRLANGLADHLIERYGTGGQAVQTVGRASYTQPSITPVLVAILILVLAEVWRFGIRLQDDVEATV